jgi:hypothetical protein
MTRPTASDPPQLDAPAPPPSLHDLHCLGCGYLLRGLDTSHRCPECGKPIAATLAELALRAQTSKQLKAWYDSIPAKLLGFYGSGRGGSETRGRRRAIACGAVGLLSVQACLLVGFPDVRRLPPRGLPTEVGAPFIVVGLVTAASFLLIAVRPTLPDPTRLRVVIRWAVRIAAVGAIGATVIPYCADHFVSWDRADHFDGTSFAMTVVVHFGAVAIFHLLAAYAWRLRGAGAGNRLRHLHGDLVLRRRLAPSAGG